MAKKKDTQVESTDSALNEAAKTIGKAAGVVASAVGVTPHTKSLKVPKLAKKNKHRIPRREKKALKKGQPSKV